MNISLDYKYNTKIYYFKWHLIKIKMSYLTSISKSSVTKLINSWGVFTQCISKIKRVLLQLFVNSGKITY